MAIKKGKGKKRPDFTAVCNSVLNRKNLFFCTT